MALIAGHDFCDTPTGRRCITPLYDGTVCGCSWFIVRNATVDDLHKTGGLAHNGTLNETELAQIVKAREEEEEKVWAALVDAASAGQR